MLPNFFVIGAPRSGTTSLYEYLRAHPDVYMSPVKEPDFFSRASLDLVPSANQTGTGALETDALTCPPLQTDLAQYLALFDDARGELRRGEASAVYLGHPSAALHIRRYLPDAPLLVILRDPVERAHSHLVHGKRVYADHGLTGTIGAGDRPVDEEFARVVDATYRDGPSATATSDPEVWIRSGFYFDHLTRWFSLFPRDQLKLFLYEDLVDDPGGLMRETFAFLGLDDTFAVPTTEAFNASVVPRNQSVFSFFTTRNPVMRRARELAPTRVRAIATRSRNRLLGDEKPTMDPELERRLRSIYHDDTVALQELIGRDLSAWLRAG